MRVPLSLLRRFVPVPSDSDLLAPVLNGRVSEVEGVERFPAREKLADVRFVRLLAPSATGNGHTRWSTDAGAAVVVADKYAVAAGERFAAVLAGGCLPDGNRVEARRVAGLDSEGMLVSEAHLGVGHEAARPLRVADDATGHAFDVLGCGDAVLEFDLEPNRPDLFSIAGMARDCAAIWSLPYGEPFAADLSSLPPIPGLDIEIRTSRARRYEAVLVRGVRVGPSPQWLQNAVRLLGMRSINNVVDAANLAMMETGQPLHTFDLAKLTVHAGRGSIVLRMAENGERITTLDGVERALTDECLLVCDGEVPVAIAGVMGDARSEVSESTTDLVIEGAAFDMAAVRRASRRLSLRTEASTRFEKGLPLSGVGPAIGRLVELLCGASGVAGGRPTGRSAAGETPPSPVEIPLDVPALLGRLGMDLSEARVREILVGLGFEVAAGCVRVPERRPDLRIPQDLVEEIGRVHGYEHVRSEAPALALVSPRPNAVISAATRARRVLGGHGWDEVYLPVWIGETEVEAHEIDRAELVALVNPIADNLKYFRPSAWPALLEAVVQNRKELDRFAIYEVGKVYRRRDDGTIEERAHLAGAACGLGLLDLRDALVAVVAAQGGDRTVSRAAHPGLHPGRTFRVGPSVIAGELHPRRVRNLGLREAPVVFAADLETLARCVLAGVRYEAPSRFPVVDLDLNVEVPARVEAGEVVAAVPAVSWLREARCVDVYPLPAGARLTLSFRFGSPERSLALEEAMQSLDGVRAAMRERGWSPA